MSTAEPLFLLAEIKWLVLESREIHDGPRRSSAVAVQSADVLCLRCDHSWRAQLGHGVGRLDQSPGRSDIGIQCPNCGVEGAVPRPDESDD